MKRIIKLNITIITLILIAIMLKTLNARVAYASTNENVEDGVLTPELQWQYIEESLNTDSTYSSNIYEYENFLKSYYDNLTYNFGMNYKGSCGYVAIGMLLSYYDTFLSDDIIPEQYDVISAGNETDMVQRRNSPGIKKDLVLDPNETSGRNINGRYGYNLSAADYYNVMLSMANSSLHAKLITIGADYGYYNFADKYGAVSTNFSKRLTVLSDYLKNVARLDESDFNISYINNEYNQYGSAEVREFAIREVKKGNPVLLSIGSNLIGHVVIAYDYDETIDNLYCHFGLGSNKTHVTMEDEGYITYKSALVLNFTNKHSHSNNYEVTTVNNNIPTNSYYCYDSQNIHTYTHAHSYDYSYVYQSIMFHKSFCQCGSSVKNKHNIINGECKYCGYGHSHNYDGWKYYNNSQHIEFCVCGEVGTTKKNHAIKMEDRNNRYARCVECNYLLDLEKDIVIVQSKPYKKRVTTNGSYCLSNGIIILVEKDVLSYMNNSLIFFDIYDDLI